MGRMRKLLPIALLLYSGASLSATLLYSHTVPYEVRGTEAGFSTPSVFYAEFQQLDPALVVSGVTVVLNVSWVYDFDFAYANGTTESQKVYFLFDSLWFIESMPNGVKDDSLTYGPVMLGLDHPATILGPGGTATLDVTGAGTPGPLVANDPSRYVGYDPFNVQVVVPSFGGRLEINDAAPASQIRCPSGINPCPYTFNYAVTGAITMDYYEGSLTAVPLPAAAWLLLSGLGGLGLAGRRRRTH